MGQLLNKAKKPARWFMEKKAAVAVREEYAPAMA